MMKRLLVLCLILAAPAHAQPVLGSSTNASYTRLYSTGTLVGNGADTTEDTLQTYTVPAGKLASVGDTIKVFASGNLAASTDSKTIRIRVGGTNITTFTASTTSQLTWSIEVTIIKTGSNTQAVGSVGAVRNLTYNGSVFTSATVTDTSTIAITVTAQNATTATAGSIDCAMMTVDFIH